MEKDIFSKDDLRLQLEVTNTLIQLGVPSHLCGFEFLREAIILTMCDKTYVKGITKRLYPVIAEEFNSTSSRVERGMRHAIEIAFIRGDTNLISDYFSYSINQEKGKASNGEFIATVADRLSLKVRINGFTS